MSHASVKTPELEPDLGFDLKEMTQRGWTEAEMDIDTLRALEEMEKPGAERYRHEDVRRFIMSKFTDKPLPWPDPIS